MNNILILLGGIGLLLVGLLVTYFTKGKKGKGKDVIVRPPGIKETILGKPRKVIVPLDHMLVEFRRRSTNQVWFEVWPKPDDKKFDHPSMEKTIFLDGSLSSNGGSHVTIDADLGVQVGYEAGLIAVPVTTEEEVSTIVDGQTVLQKQQVTKMEVVGTREWVGIDGSQTWVNERDVSQKQIAQANMADVMKKMVEVTRLLLVAIIVVSLALAFSAFLNYQVADAAGLIDGIMPKK